MIRDIFSSITIITNVSFFRLLFSSEHKSLLHVKFALWCSSKVSVAELSSSVLISRSLHSSVAGREAQCSSGVNDDKSGQRAITGLSGVGGIQRFRLTIHRKRRPSTEDRAVAMTEGTRSVATDGASGMAECIGYVRVSQDGMETTGGEGNER